LARARSNFERIPAEVRPLLRRCLEKDPRKRQRDIGDVRIELESVLAARASSSRAAAVAAQEKPRAGWQSRAVIAALALRIGAGAGIGLRRIAGLGARTNPGSVNSAVRLSVSIPPSIRVGWMTFTTDGSALILHGAARRSTGR